MPTEASPRSAKIVSHRKKIMTDIATLPVYRNVPKDVRTKAPTDIIFAGTPGTPFYTEITAIERQAEEVRVNISRYLAIWQSVADKATEAGDTHVQERADREIAGLYAILARLGRAAT